MRQYLDLLQDILDNGAEKEDRTGVGTKSLFGRQFRVDLSKGFPLLTTKKLHFKSIAIELLWFLSGDVNTRFLNDHGVTIWNEWSSPEGDLGKVYGYQWRNVEHYYPLPDNIREKPLVQKCHERVNPSLTPDLSRNTHGLVGKSLSSSECGEFVIIKEYVQEGNAVFDCQFTKTGFLARGRRKYHILEGQVRDPYCPNLCGVACLGEYKEEDKWLLSTWKRLIGRCYDQKENCYSDYGGRGIFVDDRWLCFANFANDFTRIYNWELKKEYPKEYTLDKDASGANFYSTETCRWSSKTEQAKNARHRPEFRDEKIGYRHVDQVKKLIAMIKHSPDSRRLIMCGWNVAQLEEMALPPCHCLAQFWVHDGKLSCQLYQRSVDAFLGLPYNISSYALLTMLIAQQCNLELGELVHTSGDLHLYSNHIEQAKLQIARKPRVLPRLVIQRKPETIFDYKYEDFLLMNYTPHPHIKANIAVDKTPIDEYIRQNFTQIYEYKDSAGKRYIDCLPDQERKKYDKAYQAFKSNQPIVVDDFMRQDAATTVLMIHLCQKYLGTEPNRENNCQMMPFPDESFPKDDTDVDRIIMLGDGQTSVRFYIQIKTIKKFDNRRGIQKSIKKAYKQITNLTSSSTDKKVILLQTQSGSQKAEEFQETIKSAVKGMPQDHYSDPTIYLYGIYWNSINDAVVLDHYPDQVFGTII